MSYADRWETVNVEVDDGIAWVELNRPDKRNAMNPTLNCGDGRGAGGARRRRRRCGVLVLTGAGEALSAGMDLKEYFREVDERPRARPAQGRAATPRSGSGGSCAAIPKPTIAMVNGWCFGGAFTPLVACDLAIAADEATFGLSEINWGIPPGSVVNKALADTVGSRDGAPLRHDRPDLRRPEGRGDGPRQRERAARASCAPRPRRSPRAARARTRSCCAPPSSASSTAGDMSWDQAEDYLYAKLEQSQFLDAERGREQGLAQFLDEKSYRPGLGNYSR